MGRCSRCICWRTLHRWAYYFKLYFWYERKINHACSFTKTSITPVDDIIQFIFESIIFGVKLRWAYSCASWWHQSINLLVYGRRDAGCNLFSTKFLSDLDVYAHFDYLLPTSHDMWRFIIMRISRVTRRFHSIGMRWRRDRLQFPAPLWGAGVC